MSRCNKCGVDILDNTCECPLCHSVLDVGHASVAGNEKNAADAVDITYSSMYPNAAVSVRRFRFAERLVLFTSVVAMMGLMLANIIGRPFVAWTVIIGLILVYVNTALRMAITGRVGYQSKTLWLTFIAVAILIGIDALTGFRGWSLNAVLPSAILLLSLITFILLFVNIRNWQSYIPLEIFLVVVSVFMLILSLFSVITYPNIVYIALAVSVLLLSGTLILGGDRAKRELFRRFHI